MSTFPLVSIVIVSWNARDYLAECLESLRSGVYVGPTETIVVDNASADGSANGVKFKSSFVSIRTGPTGLALHRWTWPKSSGSVLGILSTHLPHVLGRIGQYESDPAVTVRYYVAGPETGPNVVPMEDFVTALGRMVERTIARTVADRD